MHIHLRLHLLIFVDRENDPTRCHSLLQWRLFIFPRYRILPLVPVLKVIVRVWKIISYSRLSIFLPIGLFSGEGGPLTSGLEVVAVLSPA